jgi:hypothetical protein
VKNAYITTTNIVVSFQDLSMKKITMLMIAIHIEGETTTTTKRETK